MPFLLAHRHRGIPSANADILQNRGLCFNCGLDFHHRLLEQFFGDNTTQVFYSRQIEVRFEDQYFHWITNRAIRELIQTKAVAAATEPLNGGGGIHLMWNKRFRYFRRSAKRVVELVKAFSDNAFAQLLGYQGENLVLEAFARSRFVLLARNAREFEGNRWTQSSHDLDFIWEKDGHTYGVEVKNSLAYMREEELSIKMQLCEFLGIVPVFVVRFMPKTWINRVREAGGFVLVLKYQLYPLSHAALARAVREELGLPVDTPRTLWDGTIGRFVAWHEKRVNSEDDSHGG